MINWLTAFKPKFIGKRVLTHLYEGKTEKLKNRKPIYFFPFLFVTIFLFFTFFAYIDTVLPLTTRTSWAATEGKYLIRWPVDRTGTTASLPSGMVSTSDPWTAGTSKAPWLVPRTTRTRMMMSSRDWWRGWRSSWRTTRWVQWSWDATSYCCIL